MFNVYAQENFYQSLFPARRPRFRIGDAVPHGNPCWQLAEFLGAGGFGEVEQSDGKEVKLSESIVPMWEREEQA
jgi:hypothetical protein